MTTRRQNRSGEISPDLESLSWLDPDPHEESPTDPVLRFTPTAWAKLSFLCHHGETEVGGFGVSSGEDLLLVEEFITVRQTASIAHVRFEDDAVADYFDAQVERGRQPEQFARIWCHTHPGDCPHPSDVDEDTFVRVFGSCDWAVMFILARDGSTYARLAFNTGPGGRIEIPVEVDFRAAFAGSDECAWQAEYRSNVIAEKRRVGGKPLGLDLIDLDNAVLDDADLERAGLDREPARSKRRAKKTKRQRTRK